MGIDLGAQGPPDRADAAAASEPRHSTREIAERTGVRAEFLLALRRANGLPVSDVDERVCSDADIESAHLARRFLERGVTEEQQLAVVRVVGRGMAHAAEVMRETVLAMVHDPDASEAELARRYAERVEELMPLVGPMLEQMIGLQLRHMVRTEAVRAAERSEGALPGAREVTVCFADLVGFTRLGEEVPPAELERVAQRLVALTGDHLRGDVRLVKAIGDAAMLVAPEPDELLDVALDLVEAADAEGRDFPQLRVGMASGAALSRAGDWYGRPVNLAARVTALARPGSVLATSEIREAAADGYRWASAGRRSLKGVDGPVRLYRVRRLA